MEDDLKEINRIAEQAEALFSRYSDEEVVEKIEKALHQAITYRAAIVQSRCVEPPEGWDIFGRS